MERIGTLVVAPTTERKAEPGRFSETLRAVAADTMNGLAGTVTLAAPYLPGGAVLAGALRSAVPATPAPGPTTGMPAAPATGLTAAGVMTPGLTTAVAATGPGGAIASAVGGGGGDLMDATRALQQQAQSFNLQFLQLQESMQRESREYTALSNVMKARHDTAKSVIGNIH